MSRSVRLFDLHGVVPLRDEALIDAAYAMEAQDVDLHRGDLIPWKFGNPVLTTAGNIETIADTERCGFVTWDHYTAFDFGQPVCNDIGMMFWIEDGEVRQGTRLDVCNGDDIPLGVPCPINPATVSTGGSGEACTTFASFVYTYVNKYGQEGPPSRPTSVQVSNVGSATVGVTPAPPGFGITHIRIYRTAPDGASGLETSVGASGDMVLVGQTTANDNSVRVDGLLDTAEILPSTRWAPPPTGITALAVCPTTNTLMLARRNTVYVSHPGQYHAFARDRDMVLQDNVVGLKFYSGVMVVVTDGHPYLLNPNVNDQGAAIYQVDRNDDSVPCYNPRSIAVGTQGVIWASRDGLFLMGRTQYGIRLSCLTDQLFHLDDWREAGYRSIRGEIYDGKYYFTCDGEITCSITNRTSHSWILSYGDITYDHPTNVELTSLSIRPDRWYRSRKDILYYSIGNNLFEWNPYRGEVQPYSWISRDIVETGLVDFGAAKVIHDRDGWLIFELWREECGEPRLIFRRRLDHCQPFRLPRCLMSIDYYVRLTGTSRVRRIHMATSILDLTNHLDTTYTHGNKRLTQR